MRTIDTEKRDRVVQTVLQITMEEGLAALESVDAEMAREDREFGGF